ncbi:MAG TPA: HEAT repeat domain-containing protein, partial [Clostridia bacterium]|nr:HEAT repeat domain-containing protein [Clostridia bacterium]
VPHWLSSARGFVIYRGSAFPTNYHENVFIPDFEGHAIHRAVLRENGLEMTAERPADERNTEFLISKDTAFRPAQVISGPDGALYIADMRAGNEQGRIYRVVPEKFKRPKPPELGKAKILDLVSVLAQSDSWHQDTAARLLYERQDAAAIPLLTNMLNNSQLPLVRLQALRALDGVGGLREAHLLRALRDTDPRVREFAIRLTEKLVRDGGISEALWAYLKPLAIDPSLRVRYQMAFTLGEIARPEKAMLLAQILSRDLNNPWIQNAVFSSSSEGAGNLFAVLAGNARFRNDAAGLEFLRQLALEIGVSGRMQDVTQTVGLLAESALDRYQSFVLLGALGEGLRRTRSSLPLVDTQNGLQKFYLSAFEAAIDVSVPERVRVEAVRLLGVSPYTFAEIHDWLLLVCNPPPAPALQSAAVATLCRYDDPLLVRGLFERWRGFGPVVRHNAVDSLLGRSSYVPTVWTAAQSGRISLADLTPTQLNFIRTYREPSISQEATRRFGAVAVKRPQIVDRFKPALKLRGASERGREIFRLRCAECHVVGGQEERLGPNLAGVRVGGKEKVFMSIVEPHANVAPEYATSIVETRDGGNVLGIKIAETPTTITLRLPGNTESVWPKLNVQAVHRQTWSLMPDGLEQNFSVQDMADLLDFLMTAR